MIVKEYKHPDSSEREQLWLTKTRTSWALRITNNNQQTKDYFCNAIENIPFSQCLPPRGLCE